MTVQPTLTAPVEALLGQIALLLREGVDGWVRPDPYAAPYWASWNATPESARQVCPAGHFLFPAGLRLYPDDVKAQVAAPYCIVALNGDPEPMDQRVPSAFWQIPVMVELCWPLDEMSDGLLRTRLAMLTGLLLNDYPATVIPEQPARKVKDRLSVANSLLVYGNDTITELKTEPLRTMDGHPVARVSFKVLCSALPPA